MESSQTKKNIFSLNYLVEDDQPNKKIKPKASFLLQKKLHTTNPPQRLNDSNVTVLTSIPSNLLS